MASQLATSGLPRSVPATQLVDRADERLEAMRDGFALGTRLQAAQHQDRTGNRGFAERDRFLHGCHGEVHGTGGSKRPADGHGAVPVGIGLDHAQDRGRSLGEAQHLGVVRTRHR